MMNEIAEKRTNQLDILEDEISTSQFAEDVHQGLMKVQKSLPCVYFYDARGSQLFENICDLPEYYPTRTEASILQDYSSEIASLFPKDVNIIELGSGSSVKTCILLETFINKNGNAVYKPIDVSNSILEQSARKLEKLYSNLQVFPVTGRYEQGLLESISHSTAGNLILWLGSSIGNYERDEAVQFLRSIRQLSTENTKFLVGIDLRKDKHILEKAYDDGQGITASFNLNLLERINRELNADFKIGAFKHSAIYNDAAGKIEMHLISTRKQAVTIGYCGIEVFFDAGETIHTENSFKYSLAEIDDLAEQAGFKIEKQWFDDKKWFSLNLLSI